MTSIGLDIGSTCAKAVVLDDAKKILLHFVLPTGWSSVDTAEKIRQQFTDAGFDAEKTPCVATGYGRVAVPFANKTVTEITCHGLGAIELFHDANCVVIDIGGQDTKVIRLADGAVNDFMMNDKCSAGTGRFLEVMANTLAIRPDVLCEMARSGGDTTISSMCTVFAESEVISLIGCGTPKENIAYAVVDSIAQKVASQFGKIARGSENIYLTGGLCDSPYLLEVLSVKLNHPVRTTPMARYAGAIGAACRALQLK